MKVLGLDEIAPHKGHGRFHLIITAPELGIVLDVLSDRKKGSLEAWFDERGADWCAAVEVCCADMWDAYHEAAQAKLRHAKLTVDRFHLMQNLNDAVTQARRSIQKRADTDTQALLKGCRWLLEVFHNRRTRQTCLQSSYSNAESVCHALSNLPIH